MPTTQWGGRCGVPTWWLNSHNVILEIASATKSCTLCRQNNRVVAVDQLTDLFCPLNSDQSTDPKNGCCHQSTGHRYPQLQVLHGGYYYRQCLSYSQWIKFKQKTIDGAHHSASFKLSAVRICKEMVYYRWFFAINSRRSVLTARFLCWFGPHLAWMKRI